MKDLPKADSENSIKNIKMKKIFEESSYIKSIGENYELYKRINFINKSLSGCPANKHYQKQLYDSNNISNDKFNHLIALMKPFVEADKLEILIFIINFYNKDALIDFMKDSPKEKKKRKEKKKIEKEDKKNERIDSTNELTILNREILKLHSNLDTIITMLENFEIPSSEYYTGVIKHDFYGYKKEKSIDFDIIKKMDEIFKPIEQQFNNIDKCILSTQNRKNLRFNYINILNTGSIDVTYELKRRLIINVSKLLKDNIQCNKQKTLDFIGLFFQACGFEIQKKDYNKMFEDDKPYKEYLSNKCEKYLKATKMEVMLKGIRIKTSIEQYDSLKSEIRSPNTIKNSPI